MSALAEIPPGYFVVQDQDGANDENAQVDLTQMGRDDSDPTVYKLFWSWDATDQWPGGGSTGDACALFDANGNGRIDFVVCGQITEHKSDGGGADGGFAVRVHVQRREVRSVWTTEPAPYRPGPDPGRGSH